MTLTSRSTAVDLQHQKRILLVYWFHLLTTTYSNMPLQDAVEQYLAYLKSKYEKFLSFSFFTGFPNYCFSGFGVDHFLRLFNVVWERTVLQAVRVIVMFPKCCTEMCFDILIEILWKWFYSYEKQHLPRISTCTAVSRKFLHFLGKWLGQFYATCHFRYGIITAYLQCMSLRLVHSDF